jgi:eukaryotic-like serine/threonine-protein kinase
MAWSQKNPQFYYALEKQAIYEAAHGRVRRSEELFESAIADAQKEVGAEAVDYLLDAETEAEIEIGRTGKVQELMKRVKDRGDLAFIETATKGGEISLGEAALRKPEQFPHGTFEHYVYLPEIRALLALHRRDAASAVTALGPAIPYELSYGELIDLRAQALLAAHQLANARQEYQKLIDHPGLDDAPFPRYTLAHLGLARTLALEGNAGASRDEYQKFFALWHDADPDVPVLIQAHAEFSRLQPSQ